MLMITTTVRVLNRIHRRAAHLWPRIALHPVLVELVPRLQHRLVHAATACHDADDSTASRWDRLTSARWQTNAALPPIIRMADDHARTATSSCKPATIGCFLLNHRDDGAFRHLPKWHHISYSQLSFCTAVHKLS